MRFDKFFIGLVYLLGMLALISDYKALSNAIGSVATIITLAFLVVSKKRRFGKLEHRTCICVFLFWAYFVVSSLPNFSPNKWWVSIMVYLMVFTPFFLFAHLYQTNDIKLSNYLIRGFFVIWTVFLVLCFTTCYTIPDLARMMAAERGSYYGIINGGGYSMGYGSAILCPYLYNRLLGGEFKGGWLKLFVIFEIVLMIATILVINSYVTLIALIAGLMIATINSLAKSSNLKYISYTFFGIILLLLYFNAGPILSYLINNTDNEFWKKRLVETYESAIVGENSLHVDERERVYQISIDGFIKSPVFGNGYKNGNAFESEGTNGIGNHSTVLDSLSQFGIIGALPLFLFLLYPWRRARSKGEDWGYIIPFFIMACLNPVIKCFHLMVILFLIIPCMEMIKCDLITNKGKERRRVSLK